jgi:hypothetical protein
VRLVNFVITVHENIFPSGVSMQVTVEYDIALLFKCPYQSFNSKVFWMKSLQSVLPAAIKVLTCQRTSVVAVNDSIRIEHRDDFKNKAVSEDNCLWCITDQELNQPFHHPRGITLSRMDSRRNEYSFFSQSFLAFWVLILTGNTNIFTAVASQCLNQCIPVEELTRGGVLLYSCQVITQVRISVRKAMREIYLVIVVFKGVSERECVVVPLESASLFFEVILVIANISAASVPSQGILIIMTLLGREG